MPISVRFDAGAFGGRGQSSFGAVNLALGIYQNKGVSFSRFAVAQRKGLECVVQGAKALGPRSRSYPAPRRSFETACFLRFRERKASIGGRLTSHDGILGRSTMALNIPATDGPSTANAVARLVAFGNRPALERHGMRTANGASQRESVAAGGRASRSLAPVWRATR